MWLDLSETQSNDAVQPTTLVQKCDISVVFLFFEYSLIYQYFCLKKNRLFTSLYLIVSFHDLNTSSAHTFGSPKFSGRLLSSRHVYFFGRHSDFQKELLLVKTEKINQSEKLSRKNVWIVSTWLIIVIIKENLAVDLTF